MVNGMSHFGNLTLLQSKLIGLIEFSVIHDTYFISSVIPAQAGIQTIIKTPTKWDNSPNVALSAMRSYISSWIPACAGMTTR